MQRPSAAPPAAFLVGRHALVTGASRGIGAAIARRLAAHGAHLTLVARNAEPLAALADEIAGDALACDVTDAAALARAFARASARQPVDILVNNAGGAASARFADTSAEQWAQALALNLTAAFDATKLAVPAMEARGWGRIVNVASTAGLKGYPFVSAYVAAKHGLIGLTRALGLELARTGVTVNAVCPGFADTPMLARAAADVAARTGGDASRIMDKYAAANPMGRLVAPDEVAAAVTYLCSPAAGGVTGTTLAVAGGEI
jgi:NAD(P)-dependent dehydrogenase (short-subunit alcohol dehydrogenase family)